MAKAKRKLLPKDFDVLLKAGDIAALKAVFDTCEIDARGGYGKQVALAFYACPDELARWLVEQGADLEARDTYGRTPLHNRVAIMRSQIEVLLELGADVHVKDNEGNTPLHMAARFANAQAVRALLRHGARANALNVTNLTPLAAGLQYCSNAQIEAMAQVAEALLAAQPPSKVGLGDRIKGLFSRGQGGSPVTPQLQAFVRRIGEQFEFHRAGFNPDYIEATSAGLDRLYMLFDVPPVPPRHQHDGRSPIVARSARWQDQQQELWKLLVPSKGAAATVQGEVIRIAGRIGDEVDRNGGANWDAGYRKMASAFLKHVGSGVSLPAVELARAAQLVAGATKLEGAGEGLCELAVHWVRLNPSPEPLPPPDYDR